MVSYGTLSPATSPPVYVTWDEAKIFVDLITELASAVTTVLSGNEMEDRGTPPGRPVVIRGLG